MKKSLLFLSLCGIVLLAFSSVVNAAHVTLTPATGGGAITSDTTGGAYTPLTGPSIAEGTTGDISTGTIVLNAPSGFEFNPGHAVTMVFSGVGAGSDVSLNSVTAVVTVSTITITVTAHSTGTRHTTMTYSGIQVRPTAVTPLANGSITKSGTSTYTVSSGSYGDLAEIAPGPLHLAILQQPSSTAQAGIPFATQPIVAVEDSGNNIVSGNFQITAIVTGGPFLDGGFDIPANGGIANFSVLSYADTGTITIDFVCDSADTVTSDPVSIAPGPPTAIAFVQDPAVEYAGHIFSMQPIVQVTDQFGHLVTNLPASSFLTIALTSGTGRMFGQASMDIGATAGQGTAVFTNLEVNTGGNKQLTASYPGLPNAISDIFTNNGTAQRFTLNANYSTGNTPNGISLGDFRGTGTWRDMVVANTADNTVTIRLCNDDGTFSTAANTYPVGLAPVAPMFLDTDNDGNDEFVVANSGTNTITVWKNQGHAAFSNPQTYVIGTTANPNPVALTVADVNHDGRLDIITANAAEGTISVLFGGPGSTFGHLANFSVGNNPQSVYVADINGDTFQDIIVANTDDGTISILQGFGNGNFDTNLTLSPFPGGNPQPVKVIVTDINRDGRFDLITVNRGSNSISIFTNQNSVIFKPSATYQVGTHPTDFVIRDLDGDGLVDLVVANSGSGTFSVLMNNGDGTFAPPETVAAGAGSGTLAGSNFNGDTLTDLAVVNTGDTNVGVYLYTAPAPINSTANVYENKTTVVTVLAEALKPGTFTYSIASGPSHGTIVPVTKNKFSYTPDLNYVGKDSVHFRVSDGSIISGLGSLAITVMPVNVAPSFTLPVNTVTVAEDAGLVTVPLFATSLNKGQSSDASQIIGFTVTNSNHAFFSTQPAISVNGALSFKTATNISGTVTVGAYIYDNGGTNNGGVNRSPVQTFTITVTPVNDPPHIPTIAAKTMEEDGVQTFNIPITDVDTALSDLLVTGTSSNQGLLPDANIVSSFNGVTWALTITPTASSNGTVTVTVVADDQSGGLGTNHFSLKIVAVNHAPSFDLIDNSVTTISDTGLQTNVHFATNLTAGPPNESAQTLSFVVSGYTPTLYSTLPSINSKGDLIFGPTSTKVGTDTITVRLKDNGNNLNGGTNESPAQTFTLTITTNNFWHISGTYNGLFYDNPVQEVSAGFVTFSVDHTRAFSGSISVDGGKYSFSGKKFDTNGAVNFSVIRTGKPALNVNLQLDLTTGTDQVIGTVDDGVWNVPVQGYRAASTLVGVTPGAYTIAFTGTGDGTTSPEGDGIGDVSLTAGGVVTLTGGILPDTTTLSQSTFLSKSNYWPFYASLYSGTGSVIGWIYFTNDVTTDMAGTLTWIKPASSSAYYPAGFNNTITVIGSQFAIVPGTPAITSGDASLTGPTLPTLTNPYNIDVNSVLTVPANASHLSLSLAKTTGFVTGLFSTAQTGVGVYTQVKGVLIQKENTAHGFFYTPHQSGDFLLQGN